MHSTADTGDDRKSKPETVTFYNSNKLIVDAVDQVAKNYTVNAVLTGGLGGFFYKILDLAAVNAHILYTLVTGSKISRKRYLLRLSEELRAKLVEKKS